MQIPEDQFRPSKSASLEVDFRNLHCNSFPSGFMHIKICNLKGGMYREERKEIVLTICTLACSVTQLCLTLWNPMDCSLPGSSVHGISQARILEWVAISSSRGSSGPRDRTCVSCVSCPAGISGKPILKWYHLHIWGCWYFSWQSWFQLVIHPVWHFAWCTLHRS